MITIDCSNDNFETELFRIIRSAQRKYCIDEIQCGEDAHYLIYTMHDYDISSNLYDNLKVVLNKSLNSNNIEMVYNNLNEGRQVHATIVLQDILVMHI